MQYVQNVRWCNWNDYTPQYKHIPYILPVLYARKRNPVNMSIHSKDSCKYVKKSSCKYVYILPHPEEGYGYKVWVHHGPCLTWTKVAITNKHNKVRSWCTQWLMNIWIFFYYLCSLLTSISHSTKIPQKLVKWPNHDSECRKTPPTKLVMGIGDI